MRNKIFITIIVFLLIPTLSSAQSIKAKRVRIEDTGDYYTSSQVEGALQEIGSSSVETDPLSLHTADTANVKDTHIDWGSGVNQVDTDDMPEGTNKYYSSVLFNADFAGKSTTDLSEGTNLYFTNERADDRIGVLIQNGTGLSWIYDDTANTLTGDVSLTPFSTTNLSEGTNLYYTDTRARAAISEIATGLDYNSGTGVLSLTTGYIIPTTTNESNWNAAYSERGSQIAGDHLSWDGANTELDVDDDFLLNIGDTATGDYDITGTVTATTFIGDVGSQGTVLGSSYTVDNALDASLRNGIYSGLTVSEVSPPGLDVKWTAGVAYIDTSIFAVDSNAGTTLTDNATNYLYISKDDASLNISTSAPTGDFALVSIVNTYNAGIHNQFDFPLMSGNLREAIWEHLDDIHPVIVISGLNVAIDTDVDNANDFTIEAGSYYSHVLEKTSVDSTLYSTKTNHTADNTVTYYHSPAWTSGTSKGVDFAYWDNGTTLTAVNVSKWYCGFIFLEENNVPIYVYPQVEYGNKGTATDADIVYPPAHESYVVPLARFVFRGSASDFTNSNRAFFADIRPFHGYSTVELGLAIQNVFQTIAGDTGTTTADEIDDTLTIAGTASQIGTSVVGDTLTIALDSAITDAITANTAKDTNVPTALSTGTVDRTSYGITSDGGADDVVLAQADTNNAGVLSADKWDEIVANTLKETNVSTSLSLGTVGINTVAITSDGGADDVTLPAATVVAAGMLTTAKWAEIVANNAKNTNVPTALSAGTITATTYGITSDGGADDIVLPEADTTNAGLLGADKWDEIVANTLKETNVTTDLSAGTRTATTYDVNSSDGANATLVEADTTNAGILGSDKWDEIVANTAAKHAAVTLAADANVLLGLSAQELNLDPQVANVIFAGPATGVAADPTFRALVAADIPDISATYEVQLNNEAGLYAVLSDVTDFIQAAEANAIDSGMYVDGSIDHEHLAPDVISGMTDTTIADADYLLFWDATDSALKRVDAAELTATVGALTVQSKSAAYTVLTTDDVILCDTSGGAFTLTLFAASAGERVWVKLIVAGNNLTIDGNGAETIEDAATFILYEQYEAVLLIADADEWFIF